MDKNTVVGFSLIFLILIGWNYFFAPSEAELAREEARVDSLRMIQEKVEDSLYVVKNTSSTVLNNNDQPDSIMAIALANTYGGFANAAAGIPQEVILENDKMKVTFSTLGGVVTSVELKDYKKMRYADGTHEAIYTPLVLMEDPKNKFEYFLPINGKGEISSQSLYFDAQKNGNTIVFKANATNGGSFEQIYTLDDDKYSMDYQVKLNNLNNILAPSANELRLNWVNYLDKIEENTAYERNYSTIYFKPTDDDVDNCSCTGNDEEELEGDKLKWVAHTHQFFSSALIAQDRPFLGMTQETEVIDEDREDLKILHSNIAIPFNGNTDFAFEMYVGPNKFEVLESYGHDLTDIIPFGSGIFGTVNRWLIRPVFNGLSSFIGSAGLVILILTIIVKLAVYPLTYKMIRSQSKMAALKPQLASLKTKFKDDQQAQQMESMKLYREFGVNPMGGCFPMLLQMPIWFALYRFFPASIEFRQEQFLWAEDLSSYDVFAWLPFDIPFYGDHVSLFTLLWAGTTVLYSWYNMRHLDMNSMSNPMMKYMQYLMPITFLFFFNSFSAGLTCYLFFSSVFNIGQTVVTKNYLIDHDKIKAELEAYKKKPKKKGGFQDRLQKALAEQQKIAAEREKRKKK